MTHSVAVIGAGAAGLCAGRHLISDLSNFEFDIYEQQKDVGGTWRYSEQIGTDEYGLPIHSSMYKNLRTNLPKEAMAFPDFPFSDCGGRSFVHHSEVLYYLEEYAKHYGIYKHIKFHHLVESVEPQISSTGETEWIVTTQDLQNEEKNNKVYDAVMVCNGHYSVPYIPDMPDLSNFEGILIHSHDYRDNAEFRDLKVAILGAGASGIDIALEVATVAKEVVLSHNTPPKTCPLPTNMIQEKGIEFVQKSTVRFIGGKTYYCDAIIICTGYLYTYPFLHSSCKIEIGDQKVSPLYMHMFLINNPTLAIWAVPKLILPFPIYDQQVKVFLKFLKGIIQLPSKEIMYKEAEDDFKQRIQLGFKPHHAHLMPGEFQWEYDDKLSKLGDIPPIADSVRNLFKHVHFLRTQDIINYKTKNFYIIDKKQFKQIN